MSSVSSATYSTTNSTYTSYTGTSSSSSGLTADEYITLKVQPYLDRIDSINTKIATNETKISAYQTMQTLLQSLQTYAEYLRAPSDDSKDAFSFRTSSLTSSSSTSASDLLTASIDDGTSAGSHEIVVRQVAKAARLGSSTQSSTSSSLGLEGVFTLAEASMTAVSISVTSSMSLSDIVTAINAQTSSTGVVASTIAVSTSSGSAQYELVLTASDTGESISLSTASGTVLSDLGVTSSDGSTATNILQAAQSAIIDVDGISGITRSSNDITDVLDGVELNLTKADASSTITMEITNDTTSVENAIYNFVTVYNEWRDFVSLNQTVDSSTSSASDSAVLFGDSTLRSVANSITNALTKYIDSSGLSAIGITFDSSNDLVIDTTTLEDALSNSFDTVQKLFEYSATSSDSALTMSNHNSATYSGTLTLTITTDGSSVTGVTGTDSSGNAVDFTYSGHTIKGASGSLYSGLTFYYTGTDSTATMTVTTTQGIGDAVYQISENYGDADNGIVESVLESLQDTDSTLEDRASTLQTQANNYADFLLSQYSIMESKISAANTTYSLLQALMASDNS